MKRKRHALILELIQQYEITTQDELLAKLRENGFEVTQATVSRDIKELRLVKAMSPSGQYRYMPARRRATNISQNSIRSSPAPSFLLIMRGTPVW